MEPAQAINGGKQIKYNRQTLIYHLIERFEGKIKRFFKLRPKKKFNK